MAVTLVLLAAIVISLRTRDGMLVVTIDEPGAKVQVFSDKGLVETTRQVETGSITIPIAQGKHRLQVTKDGFVDFAEKFDIKSGSRESITVKLLAAAKPAVAAAKKAGKAGLPMPRRRQSPLSAPTRPGNTSGSGPNT